MKFLNSLTLKQQLVILVLVITFFATFVSFSVHTVNAIGQLKEGLVAQNLLRIEQVENRIFNEYQHNGSVSSELSGLIVEKLPNIEIALCRSEDTALLFEHRYSSEEEKRIVKLLGVHEYLFVKSELLIQRDHRVGEFPGLHCYFGFSAEKLQSRIWESIIMGVALFSALMLLSYIFIVMIQNVITGPINHLAQVSHTIAESGDYSIRVDSGGSSEIKELHQRFNEMVQHIQMKEWERDEAEIALRFSEERFRGAFEHASIGMALIGISGEFLQVNSELCEMLGYSPTELQHRELADMYPSDLREGVVQELKSMIVDSGLKKRVEKQFVKKDGSTVHVIFSYLLHKDAEDYPQYFVVQVINITARIKAEKQIYRLNEELEMRVEHRTMELIKLNKELGESLQNLNQTQEQLVQSEKMAALGSLVAGVAHEINTPIGIAVTAASFLEERTNTTLGVFEKNGLTRGTFEEYIKTASESTRMILSNMKRASGLIKSFKKVAVDQTRDEKREFNVKGYIEDTLLSLKPQLKQTHIAMTVKCPDNIMMHSYPGEISQVLTNLIMNSVVHGYPENDEHGKINITVVQGMENIEFTYQDNGIGIPAENMGRIFDPFFTTSRGKGGTGLGMHLIYNIVTHKLMGTIRLLSLPNDGVSFIIKVPIATQGVTIS
ncbi:MAG: PAS domain S-box protein [Fibrobacterales bacterium]